MILIDANLLIYAVDSDSSHHKPARKWLEATLSSTTEVGLAWIVVLAFIRITTRQGIMRDPLSVEAAISYVESWLRQPFVETVVPGEGHWPILRSLLKSSGSAGNLTSDAHLAALALEYGADIYSADHDFKRFLVISHINPLE